MSQLDVHALPEGDFHTVAGFVLLQLEHLPEVGEHFDYEGSGMMEIVDLDGRRIDKVLAIPPRVPEMTAG